jgi:hypothetical protein
MHYSRVILKHFKERFKTWGKWERGKDFGKWVTCGKY